jgi:ankyrin repeat protein
LLSGKSNIEDCSRQGWTSLHFATIYSYEMAVQLFLDKKANVKAMTSSGKTPLIPAENKAPLILIILLSATHLPSHISGQKP